MSLAWEQRQFECSFGGEGGEGGEGGKGGEGRHRVFEASSGVVKSIREGLTLTLTLTLTLNLTLPLTLTLT